MSPNHIPILPPDSRAVTFQQLYTTNDRLKAIQNLAIANTVVNAIGFLAANRHLGNIEDRVQDLNWAVERGFSDLQGGLSSLEAAMQDGFRGMTQVFDWGFARLCWQHEQDRQAYQQMLDVLQNPLATQALELRARAEKAIQNHWWEEAAKDLESALENNNYDYLAHLQLARLLFFQFSQWQPALDHAKLAAKYADAVEASENQKYYAALAYSHISLLWRMDALTNPERADECYRRAQRASSRALELTADLTVAFHEELINLVSIGDLSATQRVFVSGLVNDEELLVSVETNPDIASLRPVKELAERWNEYYARYLAQARDSIVSAQKIIAEWVPDFWKPSAEIAGFLSDGVLSTAAQTPRLALGQITASVLGLLDSALEQAEGKLVAETEITIRRSATAAEELRQLRLADVGQVSDGYVFLTIAFAGFTLVAPLVTPFDSTIQRVAYGGFCAVVTAGIAWGTWLPAYLRRKRLDAEIAQATARLSFEQKKDEEALVPLRAEHERHKRSIARLRGEVIRRMEEANSGAQGLVDIV